MHLLILWLLEGGKAVAIGAFEKIIESSFVEYWKKRLKKKKK